MDFPNSKIESLYKAAVSARENSYSPYSKFAVGTALTVAGSDKIFAGCNVENSSYGSTICAERAAIFGFVSELGKSTIQDMVLVTASKPYDTPCGACMQVIEEFADQNTTVYLCNLEGLQKVVKFYDLMPVRFDKSNLPVFS